MRRFDLTQRQDGKWNKWELIEASTLGFLDPEAVRDGHLKDYRVWVITDVLDKKADAFPKGKRKRRR